MVVQVRVRDFDTWKAAFDEHEVARRAHGARRHWLYRTAEDPNDVVVAIEFPTDEAARAFTDDPSLRETMQRAGVEGEPHIHFRHLVEIGEYERAPAVP
jgi:heme-degrading monooxygenase HmoA